MRHLILGASLFFTVLLALTEREWTLPTCLPFPWIQSSWPMLFVHLLAFFQLVRHALGWCGGNWRECQNHRHVRAMSSLLTDEQDSCTKVTLEWATSAVFSSFLAQGLKEIHSPQTTRLHPAEGAGSWCCLKYFSFFYLSCVAKTFIMFKNYSCIEVCWVV